MDLTYGCLHVAHEDIHNAKHRYYWSHLNMPLSSAFIFVILLGPQKIL